MMGILVWQFVVDALQFHIYNLFEQKIDNSCSNSNFHLSEFGLFLFNMFILLSKIMVKIYNEKQKMNKRIRLGLTIISAVLLIQVTHSSECDSILDQGIRNTYLSKNQSNFKRVLQANFCNDYSRKKGGSSGGSAGLDLPIPDFPIELNGEYSQEDWEHTAQKICTSNSSLDEGDNYNSVLKLIASPEIVHEWGQCKKFEGGLMLNGKVVDEQRILVSMWFRNTGNVYQTRVTEEPSISGMTCDSMVRTGDIINGSTRSYFCRRYAGDTATLIVNNEFNGATLFIPKIKAIIPNNIIPDEPMLPKKVTPIWQMNGCPAFTEPQGNILVPIPALDPQSVCGSMVKSYCRNNDGSYSFLSSVKDRTIKTCEGSFGPIFGY